MTTLDPADRAAPCPFAPDARARAVLHRAEHGREALLRAAGGAYDHQQVQVLLGLSARRVYQRAKDGALLGVPGPGGGRRYPAVQFTTEGALIDGLTAVRDALPTREPWAMLRFLVSADEGLGAVSPMEVLAAGYVDRAVAAARRFGRDGGA